jgi:hypothetical protein
VLKALEVGDHVKMYAPPGHNEAVKQQQKQKHMCQWHGPLVIIVKPSDRRFVLADKYEPSRTYERHIVNVQQWVGPVPESRLGNVADVEMCTDIEVSDLILACDTPTATEVELAEVKSIIENEVTLACFGTRGKNARTAKCYPVFTHKFDVYLGKVPSKVKASRWTWKINTEDIGELIAAQGLELSKNGCMTAASLKIFNAVKPAAVLHRF